MNDLLQVLINTMDGEAIRQFLHQVLQNYQIAERSGCFPDELDERTRTHIILKLTAENIPFASYKQALANARYFI